MDQNIIDSMWDSTVPLYKFKGISSQMTEVIEDIADNVAHATSVAQVLQYAPYAPELVYEAHELDEYPDTPDLNEKTSHYIINLTQIDKTIYVMANHYWDEDYGSFQQDYSELRIADGLAKIVFYN